MNDRKSLVKVGLFIVLFSWLIFTFYWFFKGLSWIPLSVNYTLLIDFLNEEPKPSSLSTSYGMPSCQSQSCLEA